MFIAGTLILTSLDGKTKSIEDIKSGDSVVSYDVETGENYLTLVNKLVVEISPISMAHIEFANGSILNMTTSHPLYTKDSWHSLVNDQYNELIVGDVVKTVDGWSEVTKIVRYTPVEPTVMYALATSDFGEVNDDDTNDNFYANGVVTHNVPTMNSIATITIGIIPDGHSVYYGTSASSITTEITTGDSYDESSPSLSLYMRITRDEDNKDLLFGKDYYLKVHSMTSDGFYTIDSGIIAGSIREYIGLEVLNTAFSMDICLIPEAQIGTDIVVGNTIFEGVQGVKYDGVNYDTVEIDGVSYEVSGPKEITFTVVSMADITQRASYNALEGMTWESWIASDYNTSGFYIGYNNSIWTGDNKVVMTSSYINVVSTDVIIDGTEYLHQICCFMPGTQVLTSLEGDTKSIEEFKPGDAVVSYNITTGENYLAQVDKLVVNPFAIAMARVEFFNGTSLDMTSYHPIYTEDGWHSLTNYNGYDTLVVGDVAKTANGWSEVTKIVRYNFIEPQAVYTLDVSDFGEDIDDDTNDNFYANGIVVHNPTCN